MAAAVANRGADEREEQCISTYSIRRYKLLPGMSVLALYKPGQIASLCAGTQ